MHPLYKDNYLLLKNFLSQEDTAQLYGYMKDRKDRGLCAFGDLQFPESQTACFRNDIPLIRLLVREIPRVSKILGEPVLPTYVYGRIYKKGDVLVRHRDRHACEISMTINLQQDKEWPIWIQKPNGEEASLMLAPGDAVMYLGYETDHWREAFEGEEYTQVFVHYVRAYGDYAICYFDKKRLDA